MSFWWRGRLACGVAVALPLEKVGRQPGPGVIGTTGQRTRRLSRPWHSI